MTESPTQFNELPPKQTSSFPQDETSIEQPTHTAFESRPADQEEGSATPVYRDSMYEVALLEWIAPSRPFKKRNSRYYTTVAAIVFLISLILGAAGQFLPIAVVLAVGFLSYVLSSVPPEEILNQIASHGIRTNGTLYQWNELGRFWFSSKYHQRLIHIETHRFPNMLTLVIRSEDEIDIAENLSEVLVFERPALTAFDKASKWLEEKIPLDTET